MTWRAARLVPALLVLAACGSDSTSLAPGEGAVVARVGGAQFTEGDLADALGDAPAGLDSVTARDQVVEQWVHRELLVQEARKQGLDDDPLVRRLIEENERSTLEAAALDAYFAQSPAEPSEAELEAYYQSNRSALALREPYVRLRHLRVADRGRATQAQQALDRALGSPYPDSLFALVAQEFADDPAGATSLSGEYVSESRLRSLDQVLGDRIAALPAGARVAVVPVGRTFT